MSESPYLPANKDGTLLQQAQFWLEKAVGFETTGNMSQRDMAFKMALRKEQEYHAGKSS